MEDYLKPYKQLGLSFQQLEQVRLGFTHGLTINEVNQYAKNCFDALQMEEIRLALEDKLTPEDISKFAKSEFGYEQMNHVRIKIKNEKKIDENKQAELTKKHLFNFFLFALVILILSTISIGGFFAKNEISLYFEKLELILNDSKVQLEYNEPFFPMKYIKSYTKKDGVELVLPGTITTNILGEQKVLYKIKNAKKVITKELILKIVDTHAPKLELTDDEITLVKNRDSFSCRAYIKLAEDEVDQSLFEKVECKDELNFSQEIQKVTYRVQDLSGNLSEKQLIVHLKEPPKPSAVPKLQPTQPPVPEVQSQYQSGSEIYSESYDSGWIYENVGGCEIDTVHTIIEE